MKNLKNTSEAEKTVKGYGLFRPGESKPVSDYVANHFRNLEGWEVVGVEMKADDRESDYSLDDHIETYEKPKTFTSRRKRAKEDKEEE